MLDDVKWKEINGHEGYYISYMGDVFNKKRGKMLKPQLVAWGNYLGVTLGVGNAKLVHRLVAEHFVENPMNYPIVNHIDGRKWNNAFINLEWCTHKQNIIHAVQTGLRKTRLPTYQKDIIRDSPLSNKELAELYGVSTEYIRYVKTDYKDGRASR